MNRSLIDSLIISAIFKENEILDSELLLRSGLDEMAQSLAVIRAKWITECLIDADVNSSS